jgi:hypothetical protein
MEYVRFGATAVKLTITHEIDQPDSPRIHSNLKSLLETGQIGW